MHYKETTRTDGDRDGDFDNQITRYVTEGYFGDPTTDFTERDLGIDGVIDSRTLIYNTFDDYGKKINDYRADDNDGNGDYEINGWTTLTYDSNGRLLTEGDFSQDWNLDGQPDYAWETTYTYNVSGKVVSKETLYEFDGQPNSVDYRLESFTYNTKGLVSELRIDDWSLYDFEVAYRYQYNSAGQLTKTTYMDPFVFGDENFHNAETYKYSKSGGRLTESNFYDEFFTYSDPNITGDHVLEVKTKFGYDAAGRLTSELKIGAAFGDWHTVDKQLTEIGYDSNNREISRLVRADSDANGIWDAGSDMLTLTTYGDYGIDTRTIDYGANGTIESLFEVTPWDGILS